MDYTDNEYVTNSTTGRPIKVGGRVWKSLRRHGLVESAMDMDMDDVDSTEDSRPTALEETIDALLMQDDANDDDDEEGGEEEEEDGGVAYY